MPPKVRFQKEEVIDAALNIARNKGIDAVTAREVAKELQVSVGPIFTWFDSMDELKAEIYELARSLYRDYIQRGLQGPVPFLGVGQQYLQFAKDEPELYKMLFLARPDKMFRLAANFFIGFLCAFVRVRIAAVQEIDSERDGTDIEVLFLDHPHCLEDFTGFNHFIIPPSDPVHRVKDIHPLHVDCHVHRFADRLQPAVDFLKVHSCPVQVHDHHHREITVQNRLRDIQNIDVHFAEFCGHACDNARCVQSRNRNQSLRHSRIPPAHKYSVYYISGRIPLSICAFSFAAPACIQKTFPAVPFMI